MPMLKIHQECERLKEEQGTTRLPPAGRRSRWTRQTSASFKLGPSIHDEQLRNSSHSLFFSLFRREEKFSSSFFCASGQPLSVPLLYAFASGWDICSWTECLTRRSTSGEWSSCWEHPLKKINWRFSHLTRIHKRHHHKTKMQIMLKTMFKGSWTTNRKRSKRWLRRVQLRAGFSSESYRGFKEDKDKEVSRKINNQH